jgi:hypothetical protein
MEAQKGWPPYRPALQTLTPLLPGRSRGLDLICEGILASREFVFDP